MAIRNPVHARRVLAHLERERAKTLVPVAPWSQDEFAANLDADEARQNARRDFVCAMSDFAARMVKPCS